MGEVVGGLTAAAAEHLGLPTGLPVAQGGADAFVAMVGLGTVAPGQLALITGSSHLHLGEALQVDPIKPTLNAPGTNRLTLKYDKLLSSFAFNFNLRRYTWASRRPSSTARGYGARTTARSWAACTSWRAGRRRPARWSTGTRRYAAGGAGPGAWPLVPVPAQLDEPQHGYTGTL